MSPDEPHEARQVKSPRDPADDVPLGDHCYDWDLPGKPNCPHWQRTEHGTVRCLLTGWEEWQEQHPLYLAAIEARGAPAAHDLWPPPSALADEHKICNVNRFEYHFEDELAADDHDPDKQVLRTRPVPRWR